MKHLGNARGSAMVQALFFMVLVGALTYITFDYLKQYQVNSANITNRNLYKDVGVSKSQTLNDPYSIVHTNPALNATLFLTTDIK